MLVTEMYINKQLTKFKAVLRFLKSDKPYFTIRYFYLLLYMFENKYDYTGNLSEILNKQLLPSLDDVNSVI